MTIDIYFILFPVSINVFIRNHTFRHVDEHIRRLTCIRVCDINE